MKNSIITLILGASLGFGFTKVLDQPVIAGVANSPETVIKEGAVLDITLIELNEETTEKEFEEHMLQERIRAHNEVMSDTKSFLLKNRTGEMVPQYAILTYSPDTNVREKYGFIDGKLSEASQQVKEQLADLNERGLELYTIVASLDYIVFE